MSPRNLFDEHYRFMWQFRLDGKTWSEGTDLFNAKFGKMSKGGTACAFGQSLRSRASLAHSALPPAAQTTTPRISRRVGIKVSSRALTSTGKARIVSASPLVVCAQLAELPALTALSFPAVKQLNEALAKTEHQRRSGPCKQAAQRPARQAYFQVRFHSLSAFAVLIGLSFPQFLSESAARQRVENEETGVRPTGLQVLQKGLEEFRVRRTLGAPESGG